MRAYLTAALLLGFCLVVSVPPAAAEEQQDDSEAAREARILEYLKKKEERLARRDIRREAKQKLRSEEDQGRFDAALGTAAPGPARKRGGGSGDSKLPRDLAQAQQNVRRSQVSADPSVQHWLAQIDRQAASAYELAAFANFLAQNGMAGDALAYYGVAIRLVDDDPVLWINLGTLHRQLGELNHAESAYEVALSVDPNNAVAHYNLGAVLDERGKYAGAVDEYKLALTIDPTLGDPATNPQAANNERLLAVRLLLYQEQAGALGLPLLEVPGTGLESEKP